MDYDTLSEIIAKLKSMRITRKARMKFKSAKARERARGFNNGINAALELLEGGDKDENSNYPK